MFLEIAWQNKQFKISLSLLDFKQLLLDNGDIVQRTNQPRDKVTYWADLDS